MTYVKYKSLFSMQQVLKRELWESFVKKKSVKNEILFTIPKTFFFFSFMNVETIPIFTVWRVNRKYNLFFHASPSG